MIQVMGGSFSYQEEGSASRIILVLTKVFIGDTVLTTYVEYISNGRDQISMGVRTTVSGEVRCISLTWDRSH